MRQLITLFLILASEILFAHSGPTPGRSIFQGNITELGSSETLTGARVSIKGTDIVAFSDKDGNFIFEQIPSQEFEIEVQLVSFVPKSIRVDQKLSEGEVLTIALEPK